MYTLSRLRHFGMALLPVLHFLSACKINDNRAYENEFKRSEVPAVVEYTDATENRLRFVGVNGVDEGAPAIIFVHGAPGGANAFFEYMKDSALVNQYVLVSVDRLGYAGSDRKNPQPSISAQAQSISPLIDRFIAEGRRVYLVGHSYGGPIIVRAAMEYGTKISGLLLLAPAIDPDNEKVFWFTKLGKIWPFRWIIPSGLKTATYEKLAHAEELEKMASDWALVQCPVTYLHGTADNIVPFENYDFAKRALNHIQPKMIAIENENHFLPWRQYDLVKKSLINLVENQEK